MEQQKVLFIAGMTSGMTTWKKVCIRHTTNASHSSPKYYVCKGVETIGLCKSCEQILIASLFIISQNLEVNRMSIGK